MSIMGPISSRAKWAVTCVVLAAVSTLGGCDDKPKKKQESLDSAMSDACTTKVAHDCGQHNGTMCVDKKECDACCTDKGAVRSDVTNPNCYCYR